MSQPLKRTESLRKGLQRVTERRLKDIMQVMSQQGLTSEAVHEVRKVIKSLRATLRLARGGLTLEERRARNQALRDFAGRLSGPRDAAVTLAAFEKVYGESLDGNRRPKVKPRWAAQLQESLADKAHNLIAAESYRDAAERVRRFAGQMLPFDHAQLEGGLSQQAGKNDWDHTVGEGLRKTYRQGRRLMRQVAANPEASEEQWHELRKRVKDLGYQLGLIEKVEGVKPLLAKLQEVGNALGDARDLGLLRSCLREVENKQDLSLAEWQSYQTLLTRIDKQREGLHRRALQASRRAYRRSGKRFTGRIAKRWGRWKRG
jgi:CHAD domain-containing protein